MSANPQHQKAYRGIRYRIRTKKGQTPKAYYLEVYTSASAAFSSRRFGPYVSRARAEAALRAMVDEEYEKAEAQNERLRRHLQGRSAMGRASRWGGAVARLLGRLVRPFVPARLRQAPPSAEVEVTEEGLERLLDARAGKLS